MLGIDKRFGRVQANDKVNLTLYPGEIHAVLGENGAGKTTLMNILSGMYQPDSGSIALDGNPVTIGSPSEALALGIGTVYQHFTLVPNLSVIENVMLGTKTGFVLNLKRGEQQLEALLAGFELNTDPKTEVRHLSIGQRQRVEIVKVLFRGTRVLLLDEPTSVLTPSEVEGLFRILKRLREEGVSVVIITHKLEEALDVSDRVTILRGGKNVGRARSRRDRNRRPRRGPAEDRGNDVRRHARSRPRPFSNMSPPARPCWSSTGFPPWVTGARSRSATSPSSYAPGRSMASPGSTATARKSWARSSPGSAKPPAAVSTSTAPITPTRGSRPSPKRGSAISPTTVWEKGWCPA